LFEVGQEIDVKVLSFDEGRQRVSLGFKQLLDDPWSRVAAKFVVGSKTKGAIVSLTDYGAFVELEDGIEGLIHISEMSWSKRVRHPSKVVSIGDEVEVVVLAIDQEQRRISLGMKQMEPNPWEIILEKYHVGDVIRGKIRNITDFGVFIGVEEGIDGLIHISDISWTDRIKHPADVFKKGDDVEAKILAIDIEGEKFSLGIKQLTDDPFMAAAEKYRPGTKAEGTVLKVSEVGALVKISDGVEGMILTNELSTNNAKPSDVVKEGDSVKFLVLLCDTEERKFVLSKKAIDQGLDDKGLKDYADKNKPTSALAEAFSRAEKDRT
jgi:small subunit ribosomal protein S1